MSSTSSLPQADYTYLILPFTELTFTNPSSLLPLISKTIHATKRSLLVIFSSPSNEQLYATLRRDPRASWHGFQRFLGQVYGALAAAQWDAGKVLLDIEVAFEGADVHWSEPSKDGERQTVKLEGKSVAVAKLIAGYENLPMSRDLQDLVSTSTTVPLCPPIPSTSFSSPDIRPGLPVVALGGTFDHLHAAHKLLLHLALFLTTRRLIVGVMSDKLLASKSNADLVEPLDVRIANVEAFVQRIGGGDIMDVLEIHDPLGPTGYEADIQALVVSRETESGGTMVNRVREERGLGRLEMFVIDVIAWSPEKGDLSCERDEVRLKDLKMGSTGVRQWIRDHQTDS